MTTHTYAILEVSAQTYDEIRDLLEAAGYQHAFHAREDGDGYNIDMHGIALTRVKEENAADPNTPPWENDRTVETRSIEAFLKDAAFAQVDAYRYNSACIRLRVIDPRFEGLPDGDRDGMVEPYLHQLPDETQADIMTLCTFAPSELVWRPDQRMKPYCMNNEFERPEPSNLRDL